MPSIPLSSAVDFQTRLRHVAAQAQVLAESLPGPRDRGPDVPDARHVAQQLNALQFVQSSALGAADLANHIPLDPKATTSARLAAIALASTHTRVTQASGHLAQLFHYAVAADVWAIPEPGFIDPAKVYDAVRHELGAAARELRIHADRLPAAGVSYLPAQARQQAALTLPQRLRRTLTRRDPEPAPPVAVPRTAAQPRR